MFKNSVQWLEGQAVELARPELSNELVTFEQIIADLRTYTN